ncbi:endonuclease NucS domain-containing protein [Microcoleus sp. FACHB-68]|uniref:endonuclease NucS domain-containing protein n=1 Tax=Microcoleus sp. FACHB-68 TaxID=2692826 RepID=UPI001686BE92|nr:endonuclease NucS domain-containing protein [Microcoleus sp. FACHB-68]MBD1939184.1 DUF91 domain-containing protein [Microcoleus sp. FACHB-68]
MSSYVSLKKTGFGWKFGSEAALEDFVWANLEPLLGLTPLKRQYSINGQFCDILALGKNKQLVVLELKNAEDRYIVQQLTRYYDGLLEEKPFAQEVDYTHPVHLVAIQPSFHRDNFTDRKYHSLLFEFLKFHISQTEEGLNWQLINLENGQNYQVQIPQQEREPNEEDIPIPPKALQKLLMKCPPEQQEEILRIRRKILTFDRRMQEMAGAGSIKYGNGNSKTSKFCAEFCADSKGNFLMFLWLPLKGLTSEKIGRARIWTNWEGIALIEGYVVTGIGPKITSRKKVIANLTEKIRKAHQTQSSAKSFFRLNGKMIRLATDGPTTRQYCKETNRIAREISESKPITDEEIALLDFFEDWTLQVTQSPYKSLEDLLELALGKWLARL